jgi:hypothetical protein
MTATDGNFTGTITGSAISGGTITIGNNFSVDSAGNMVATNGEFTGTIDSESGTIGGWKIGETTLEGITENEDGTSSKIILDAKNAAICGGKLKPLDSDHRMKLCGSLEICDEYGDSVTKDGTNHIGYVESGLSVNGVISKAPGIGLSVDGYATLKVTEDNIGLQYGHEGSVGGYISISDGVIGMGTGGYFNISGNNITLNNEKFIINIPADKQEGIYARFA